MYGWGCRATGHVTTSDALEGVLCNASGKSRQDQAEVQARQEQQAGLRPFDPEALRHVLRDSMFYHYLCMCQFIESIPVKLAAFGERCPCHSALLEHLRPYQRHKLMGRFYGASVMNCPAAGMMGPELVAGSLGFEKSCN